MLVQDCDAFLSGCEAPPFLTPIDVTLKVDTINAPLTFNLILRNTDTMADVRQFVYQVVEKMGYRFTGAPLSRCRIVLRPAAPAAGGPAVADVSRSAYTMPPGAGTSEQKSVPKVPSAPARRSPS
jgi:hypothetical protein